MDLCEVLTGIWEVWRIFCTSSRWDLLIKGSQSLAQNHLQLLLVLAMVIWIVNEFVQGGD
jgi:hypothetical protein